MIVSGLSRGGAHIDRLGVFLSSQLLSSMFSSGERYTGNPAVQGRRLMLSISKHPSSAHHENSTDPLDYSSAWIQVDLQSTAKEMVFTFYPKMDTLHQPQIRWSMVRRCRRFFALVCLTPSDPTRMLLTKPNPFFPLTLPDNINRTSLGSMNHRRQSTDIYQLATTQS